eukprot:COSAG05_NODE_2343_length_3203_cov_8.226482_3_plen_123_part_00
MTHSAAVPPPLSLLLLGVAVLIVHTYMICLWGARTVRTASLVAVHMERAGAIYKPHLSWITTHAQRLVHALESASAAELASHTEVMSLTTIVLSLSLDLSLSLCMRIDDIWNHVSMVWYGMA